ncbi:SRPBCC domain-containing protein [Sphaerisporangium album]|uniref:SRPBCC domain-containing protein n=1 Tax=Sphaerisporangium album TaxID=509200 RepID=UPI0026917B21
MAMRFEHEFTVPVPVEQAWSVLLDVQRVAPCLPGATLDGVDGDVFTGRMKVKVGPITVTYRGEAAFESVDKDAHTLSLKASGKEARGTGTAGALVNATLTGEGARTRVTVETSFNVTGRPAQFGRGVMAEVGAKLIDKFAENLAAVLREAPEERTLTVVPDETTEETAPGTAGKTAPGIVGGTAEEMPAPEPAGEVEPGALAEPATTPFNQPEPSLLPEPATTPVDEPAPSPLAERASVFTEPATVPFRESGEPREPGEPATAPSGEPATAPSGEPASVPVAEAASPFGAPAEAGEQDDRVSGGRKPEGRVSRGGEPEEGVSGGGETRAQRHLSAVPDSYAERTAGREAHPAGTTRTSRTPDEEALDLLRIAGMPLLKRAAPLVAALAGVVLLGWLVRRLLTRR